MDVVYGCVEEVFPNGEIRGWARFYDAGIRPLVVLARDGVEIARTHCDMQRDDLGGRFGFRIHLDRPAELDVLTGRLTFLVHAGDEPDSAPIRPTEDARRMCRDGAGAILSALPDDDLSELRELVRAEAARRDAVREAADAAEPGWHRLTVPDLDELKRDPEAVVLDPEVTDWIRPGAAFVLDLSENTFTTSTEQFRSYLIGPSKRHLRAVLETTKHRQIVYGSHHFYAFVGANHTIQFQGVGDATFRLDYHIDHQNVHAGYHVPLISRIGTGTGYQISYDQMSDDNITELDGEVYFGSPIEPTNWGMWLIQGLQSAWRFRVGGQRGRLLTFASENFHRMLLDFVEIDAARIVDMAQWRVYRCEQLRALQYSHDTSLSLRPSDREVLDFIVDKARRLTQPASFPRAIFIARRSVTARKGGGYRPLLNEEALLVEMERIGLAVVEPELLPFHQQVMLFHEAELVVGLGGAGLFNVVFCRPGTRVVTIESSTAFVDNHATLFASAGLEYGVIFGRRDVSDPANIHYRWTVDVDAVVRQIADFM